MIREVAVSWKAEAKLVAAPAARDRFAVGAGVGLCAVAIILTVCALRSAARPLPQQDPAGTKLASGEYVIREQSDNGAIGPLQEEVFNFHESWSLWRDEKGQYRVQGSRAFESPKNDPHSNRFVVELSRDFTVIRVKEFAKLRWVPDSGPLSCEFLPKRLECSSGGSDRQREIKLRTPLENPYGLLWPVSPFSFSGIARQIERDSARPTRVDMVRIEQPSMANPVQAMILEGPMQYLGEESIEAAGKKWTAHKFLLKVPLQPEYLIWTSRRGLLLGLTIQHEHENWKVEGIKLERFESSEEF
jgi:hypothetical protein